MLILTTSTNIGYYTKRWLRVYDTQSQQIVAETDPKEGIAWDQAYTWIAKTQKALGQSLYTITYDEGIRLVTDQRDLPV